MLYVSTGSLYAQSLSECEKIVQRTVDAINTQNSSELKKYLAPDFECANQQGTTAVMVLDQLIVQLKEHISHIEKTSETHNGNTLTLTYDFTYDKKLGNRSTTFIFNADNQLKRLDLLSVQVKKIDVKKEFEKPEESVITIPIEIHDNLIMTTAEINGEKRNFIIDSGAAMGLYLNSKYFSQDSTKSFSSSQGVGGSISGADAITIESFNLHGIQVHNREVVMSNLSHLENGKEIYGLIGYAAYKDYDWLFDYENRTLTLINPDSTASYVKQQGWKVSEVPLWLASEDSHIPCVKGVIDGKEVTLGFDSGASTNLLRADLLDTFKEQLTEVETTELKGAGQESRESVTGKLKSLEIGDRQFTQTATVFSDIAHLKLAKVMDGLIGYEILSRQKTIISIRNKKLMFIQ